VSGRSLTYVGHATVLVELDGTRVLTDPVLRGRVLHLRRTRPAPEIPADLDGVLVSHAHWDHLDLPSLERLGHNVPIVCPRGSAGLLRRKRFGHVIEVEVGEQVRIGELTVTATFAEHEGGRGPFRTKAPALGYVIEGSARIYFAGDTALFAGMAELAPLDVALLPVAGWGRTLGPGHLDPRAAAEALRLLRPRVAVPIHWGTLATPGRRAGQDPAHEFARCAADVAPDVDVRLLDPGETLEL
jgi:L-ascorbate metabolism protein UlaG (beta-lactamase superfamily)